MIPRCAYCPFLPSGSRVGMGDQEALVWSVLSLPSVWLLPVRFSHRPTSSVWTLRSFPQTLHVALLKQLHFNGDQSFRLLGTSRWSGALEITPYWLFLFPRTMAPHRPPSFLSPSCRKPLTSEPNAITARRHSGWNALKCKGLSADLG